MTSDSNGLTPFYNISIDGKNRLKAEEMIPTIALMLDPICLFCGKLMRGLQITVHSFKEVCKYLLHNGVKFILSERFCQDDLENYFGRQRAIGSRKDNPCQRQWRF